MTEWSVSFQHIIDNPLNVQRYNRPAAFVGFQEEAVVGVVVEEILGEGGGTEGILQDVEVAFPVGISIGVVFPELVAGEPERSGLVQAIGKLVTGRLPFTCVAGPAADVHPLLAIAGSIGVDGDQADIAFAQLPAPGVDALGACPEGGIVFIRSDQGEAYCICKGEDAVIVRITSLAHPLPVIIFPELVNILHHLIGRQPIL